MAIAARASISPEWPYDGSARDRRPPFRGAGSLFPPDAGGADMKKGVNPKPGFAGNSWPLGVVTIAAVIACGGSAKPPHVVPSAANTTLINQDGRKIGTAAVLPSKAGGLLVLKLTGVPPGAHGLHLHARAVCDPPTFDSAGPHYNPAGRKHGTKNPQGPHAGDLPNVRARADSSIDTTITIPGRGRECDRDRPGREDTGTACRG